MHRKIYRCKPSGLQEKVRVTPDWIPDLFFSRDIVQLLTLRSASMSEPEEVSRGGMQAHEPGTPERP